MAVVPRSLADLTPEWLTAGLQARCPGALVAKLSIGEIEDGTNRRAAVNVAYDDGDGPSTVFIKIHGRPMHRWALVALGALTTEARIATSGVDLPIARPLPYHAAIDRRRLRTVVVMDDVNAAGGRPNDARSPLSVEEVRSGLDGLARLHAAFWNRPIPAALDFLRPWRLKARWAPISGANLVRGLATLHRASDIEVPPALTARVLEQQFRRSAILAETGPLTVLHGDPHPGNTYGIHDEQTGFYDWQLARTGHWSHDVGYFIVSSLDVAQRRTHERGLLHGYLDTLRALGVEVPHPNAAWERYRATPAYGLGTWLHTLAAGSFQPQDVSVATLRRFAAAYADLETATSIVAR